MTKAKKLIEVAMPIKEISAESVRDKSIRHGHISTLRWWWARRPWPVCRAVVCASLVPDPLDADCPQAFREAVRDLLATNPLYAPYKDIPYTSIPDEMPDNERNRLLMFIGKFSDACQKNMKAGKSTPAKDQIQEGCLIRWESRNDKKVLALARKLIWVAYNAEQRPEATYHELAAEFDAAFQAINEAESALYATPNRHIATSEVAAKEAALQAAIESFQNRMPSVFDPFAGGGAIPLEAARLGCRSYGNDINPVAHIIEKGSVEFPQKYGKPITYSHEEFMSLYGEDGVKLCIEKFGGMPTGEVRIPNRLSFDVEYYARLIIEKSKVDTVDLYTQNDHETTLVYYWVRTAHCANPSCNVEIPLLKQFYISKRRNSQSKEWIYLNPIIENNAINFEIKKGVCDLNGWNNRGNITCPCCGNITNVHQLKEQFKQKKNGERLLAIIEENSFGIRQYRLPSHKDIEIAKHIKRSGKIPNQSLEVGNTRNFNTPGWGISTFDGLFSERQSEMLLKLVENIKCQIGQLPFSPEYNKCLLTYLSILFDKILCRNTSFGVWHKLQETVEHPFGRQAIPMVFDYPEMNPFSNLSGGCYGQLQSIIDYIEEEQSFAAHCNNVISGDKNQFSKKSISCVVTDPPYYDAIAYADLSDFFYVWLKELLAEYYPLVFSTPKTPKNEECTALKHHHGDSEKEAKSHFEHMLTNVFTAIEHQTKDIVSIMFAHQSTEAWTTLCNSILFSKMNLTSSWPIDTEVTVALKNNMATLESSVTVSCRPSERSGFETFKRVKRAIENKVTEEVNSLYELGFRGADLLTACFGQAVSEFGKYETVEKADGSEVTVGELMDLARTAAFNTLLHGFDGDEYTRFYIGWLQMNGMGETDFDDAAKFARVGISVNISDIFAHNLLIRTGNKQHLATYAERMENEKLGINDDAPLIDQVHRAMFLWHRGDRGQLLYHIHKVGKEANSPFWRVLASLKELLPEGDDLKQVRELLSNSADLIHHSSEAITYSQGTLFA